MIDAAAFDALKFQGDPLADAVVADLVATNRVSVVNEVLEHFRANDQPVPEQLPDLVRDFLIATDNPPDWVDHDRVARAYGFFVDDGVHVASVLTFGAMVNCYAQPRASRALTLTHGLNQPHRRLSETSQFVMNMMGRDAFGSGGTFVPTIQKTRLIHAAVRHFLTASGRWDVEADGVPVCQQDMVGALLIFSVQVIEGMRRIGISVTEEEAADYYYVWRVTGAMLGIPVEALPESLEEARELSTAVVEAAYGPSPEGVVLTRHLLDLYERLFPGKVFDGIVAAMVRQVVNPEVADWMEVPKSRAWARVVGTGTRLVRALERSEDNSALATTILDRAGALLLGGSVRDLTNGQSTTLSIPADLHERWTAAGTCPVPAQAGPVQAGPVQPGALSDPDLSSPERPRREPPRPDPPDPVRPGRTRLVRPARKQEFPGEDPCPASARPGVVVPLRHHRGAEGGCGDVADPGTPLSHAALVAAHLEGRLP